MSNTDTYKKLSKAYNDAVSTYESRQKTLSSLEAQSPQNASKIREARENQKRALAKVNEVEAPLREYEAENGISSYFFDGRWKNNAGRGSSHDPESRSSFFRRVMRG